MEELKIYLQTLYANLYGQAATKVFTRVGLIQLGALITILLISYYLAKFFRNVVQRNAGKYENMLPYLKELRFFYFPIFFFVIASLIRLAFQELGWNDLLFNIFVTYFAVRIINRLLHIIFKNPLWLQPVCFIIWIYAILKVLNLHDETLLMIDSVGFTIGDIHLTLLSVIKGVIFILLAFWLADKIADLVQARVAGSKRIDPSLKILLNKTMRIILMLIALLVVIDSIGLKLTALTVFGGALGVGIGFGLQKIVSNFICGFFLLMDKSIKPGDVIEIENTYGTIRSLNSRYITVLTNEGKEYLIPNEDLITQRVVNWSHSNRLIRLSVEVGVSYDTDLELALKLLEEATANIKRINRSRPMELLVTNFGSSSIDLCVKFWIKDPELGTNNITSQVRLEIWRLFKKNNIHIPFPQNDVYIKSVPENLQQVSIQKSDV